MAIKTMELSEAIVSFAGAAKKAQELMTSGLYPMAIKEYRFNVNFTTDFNINSQTDVSCNFMGMTLSQKLTVGYEEHMGITIDCTIVPGVTLIGSSGGDGGE